MAKIKPTRNLTDPAYVPNPDDLDVGELALNAVTGDLFVKLSSDEVRRVRASSVVQAPLPSEPDGLALQMNQALRVPEDPSGTRVYLASENYRASGEPRDLGALTVLGKAHEEDGTPIGASLQVRSHWPGVDTELKLQNREGDFLRLSLQDASLNASATLISPKPIELNGHIKVPGAGDSGSLYVYSNVVLSDRLEVSGDSVFSGGLQADNVTAIGNSSLGFAEASDLTVSGAASIGGDQEGNIVLAMYGTSTRPIVCFAKNESNLTSSSYGFYDVRKALENSSAGPHVAYFAQPTILEENATAASYKGVYVPNALGIDSLTAFHSAVSAEPGKVKYQLLCSGSAESRFDGPVRVSSGSFSAPSIHPPVDEDTGISFPSADTMALSTSGEHRIWIRSDGGIGIGSTGQTGSAIKVEHSYAGASGIGYQSSATVSGTNYYSRFDSCQIAGSTSGYIATYCQAPVVSGSASLATYRGLVVTNPTGAESAQAVFSSINTESGKDKHNIYADGTAPNFFRGNVGVNDASPTAALTVNADTIRLRAPRTPASATDSGNRGDICWDSSYVYVCISDNVWRRASLSSW